MRHPSLVHRPLLRVLLFLALALALAIGAGAAWFGGLGLLSESPGEIAVAAPSGSPSRAPSPGSASRDGSASGRAGPLPFSVRSITGSPNAAGPTARTANRIALSHRLDQLRASLGLPGVSAAVLFADGSMWRGSSGYADVEGRVPVTRDTQFAIASISKTFLAARILTLVESDQIGLDEPASTYLPELGLDKAITVRRLLDHTSGLHDFFYDPEIDEALLSDRSRTWTADEVLGYIGEPYFRPGRGWHYSNSNYVILGLLAERVTGVPLPGQLRTTFLDPLGLAHTSYQGSERPRGPLAAGYRFAGPGRAMPPIPVGDGTDVVPFTSVVTAAGSAGSIASTAEDLVTWARALYDGNVLTARSRLAMVADLRLTAPFEPSIPYGLGVQLATVDGRPTLGHSGRLLGSRAVVRWFPDERIAIAVLTNQSRTDPNRLVRALMRVVLGSPGPS